jgi:uncharacterized protein (DUF305 family)
MKTSMIIKTMYFAVCLSIIFTIGCNPKSPKAEAPVAVVHTEQVAATSTVQNSVPFDLVFIDTMTKHHEEAIEMAKLAMTKAQDKDLKSFASRITNNQQREINKMKNWRDSWYPNAPAADDMSKMGENNTQPNAPTKMEKKGEALRRYGMQQLNEETGNAFDLKFLEMMIPHHQEAIDLSRQALTKAEHYEIKNLARDMISTQTREIEQMRSWQNLWKSRK